uniref:NADP-dependent oxidoreductase domain-containing protein n=1 Tax=Ditylum brightwellii TaxID=49249 RepID=A0A7S4WDG4_9STRA
MRVPKSRLYLGTMTFGWTSQTSSIVDEPVALEMIHRFTKIDKLLQGNSDKIEHCIDTARIYSGGKTEPILGSALNAYYEGGGTNNIKVGSKAHPSQEGGLSPTGIKSQLSASLSAMSNSVHIKEYYLHQPDTENSLLDSLRCTHNLIQDGTIQKIGMSNYHASEMERAFALCEKHDLTKPCVFQGLYNPLNRMIEKELLPVLKQNDCAFVAYNPLAAGLLTGKHHAPQDDDDDDVKQGRFQNNPNYLPRFYTKKNFEALDRIQKACDAENISMVDATFKWLLRHSALSVKDGDGVLLGASSLDQLDENLNACLKSSEENEGLLSEDVLRAFDEAWDITNEGAFPYWRSYSSDMPNRMELDQGASYEATKK